MHTRIFPALFLLCCFLLASCSSDEPTEQSAAATEERTVMLGRQPLTLEGFNGIIEVKGNQDSTASVRIEKKAVGLSQASADSLLAAITVEETERKGRRVLRVRSDDPNASADVYLSMPYKTALNIETNNSNITIDAMAAPVEVNVATGNVVVNGAAADLDIRTGNGNVEVDMVGFPDSTEVRLRTGNGPIKLALPAQVPGMLRADAKIGTVDFSGFEPENLQESKTSTGIFTESILGKGKGRIRLSSENGSIEVRKK